MKIHQFSEDSPPIFYLKQICDHCPKAASLYIDLWKNRDKNCKIYIEFNQIESQYLCSKLSFRRNLMLLVREGLANVDETSKGIKIELVDWTDE
jgi:hypothetical protein